MSPGGDVQSVRLGRRLTLTAVAGDWVRVQEGEIVEVRERSTALTRPGRDGGVQVLAANIDMVFLVLAIDHGLNVKALERLSVMAWESGATPVVVLTKCDLVGTVEAEVASAQDAAPGMDVIPTSTISGMGLAELKALMGPATTTTMLGASGAGKTSLLNALDGRSEPVAHVRRDGEGRHTTTTRRLHVLDGGGVLLDLPGIRSLDILAGEDALDETFTEIASAAQGCRFGDCTHDHEPGCAVQAAVADGVIEPRRVESWHRLQRELAYQQRRVDPAAMAAHRAQWKATSKEIKRITRG